MLEDILKQIKEIKILEKKKSKCQKKIDKINDKLFFIVRALVFSLICFFLVVLKMILEENIDSVLNQTLLTVSVLFGALIFLCFLYFNSIQENLTTEKIQINEKISKFREKIEVRSYNCEALFKEVLRFEDEGRIKEIDEEYLSRILNFKRQEDLQDKCSIELQIKEIEQIEMLNKITD